MSFAILSCRSIPSFAIASRARCSRRCRGRFASRCRSGSLFHLLDGFEHARAIVGVTYSSARCRLGAAYHERFALATTLRGSTTPRIASRPASCIREGLDCVARRRLGESVGLPRSIRARARFTTNRVPRVRFGIESGTTGTVFVRLLVRIVVGGDARRWPEHTLAGGVGYAVDQLRVDAHVSAEIVGTRTGSERFLEVKSGGEVFGAGITEFTAGF